MSERTYFNEDGTPRALTADEQAFFERWDAAQAVDAARIKPPTDREIIDALLDSPAAVTAIKARIAAARQR